MERDGVKFSVMYPPIFGMRMEDKDLGVAVIQAYNDWAAEFEASAPDHFRVVAQLLPDDPDGSTAEMLRCAEMGIRQVNFLVGTVSSHMYQPDWDAFWDTAEANNITVNYHVGGPGRSGSFLSRQSPEEETRKPAFGMGLGEGATVFFAPFTGLFSYGVLERRPNLRLCLAESGTGWIPFQVQEMDYRMEQAIDRRGIENYPLKKMPSEIFKNQVWATYQQDLVGLNLIPPLLRRGPHDVGVRLPPSGQHVAQLDGRRRPGDGPPLGRDAPENHPRQRQGLLRAHDLGPFTWHANAPFAWACSQIRSP